VLLACFLAAPRLLAAAYGSAELQQIEQQVYKKVNDIRNENRLPAVRWNEALASEARRHAGNMVERHFFAHEDPRRGELAERLDESGIDWSKCAENIYQEKGLDKPAEEAVKAWLQSPGHRKNMLDSGFTETGIGVAVQPDGSLYIVQEFIWSSGKASEPNPKVVRRPQR
jgi:uncharacterized protein YkwD